MWNGPHLSFLLLCAQILFCYNGVGRSRKLPHKGTAQALEDPYFAQHNNISWGQVSGVATSLDHVSLYAFHRWGSRWGARTFRSDHNLRDATPIPQPAVLRLNYSNGNILAAWGKDTFYLPHSITVVPEDSKEVLWVTDVGSHQALKFTSHGQLLMELGTKLTPGHSPSMFCQPTDVAVDKCSGEVFVSDGYCNTRVAVFDKKGKYLREFGGDSPPGRFNIAHSLVLDGCGPASRVFVADREKNRIQVYLQSGKFVEVLRVSGAPYALTLFSHKGVSMLFAALRTGSRSSLVYTPLQALEASPHPDHLWRTLAQNISLDVSTLYHDMDAAESDDGRPSVVLADINQGLYLHKFYLRF